MTPMPGHFDYDERIKRMDEAKVDGARRSATGWPPLGRARCGGAAIAPKQARRLP